MAYDAGWLAFNDGCDCFSNPFTCKHEELFHAWKSGWEACRNAWLNPDTKILNNKPIKTPLPV